MITFIEKGDIFNIGKKNFAHGCNCAGAMGKGIAVQFRDRYPAMYIQYKALCGEGKFLPGDLFTYKYGEGYIFNLGTQLSWRTKAKLAFVTASVEKMLRHASDNNVTEIALPKIGAGLGGLPWDEVKRSLIQLSERFPAVDLFLVEDYEPNK